MLISNVQDWINCLTSSGLMEKIFDIVRVDHWERRSQEEEEALNKERQIISQSLLKDKEILNQALPYLTSHEASGAFEVGKTLASLNGSETLLSAILPYASAAESTYFFNGYLKSLVENNPQTLEEIYNQLDCLQEEKPEVAFFLAAAKPKELKWLERGLFLIDSEKLSANFLLNFQHGIEGNPLNASELYEILLRIDNKVDKDSLLSNALRILSYNFDIQNKEYLDSAPLIDLIFKILNEGPLTEKVSCYSWSELLMELVSLNPEVIIAKICDALISESYTFQKEAESMLVKLSQQYLEMIFNNLSKKMLDESTKYLFRIYKFELLFKNLPLDQTISWIKKEGVELARLIARHLPIPYVDEKSSPKVPELTKFILEEYETDQEVFRNFLVGNHSHQWYSGDIASQYEKEGKVAQQFLDYPLKRIQEWAVKEQEESLKHSKYWKQKIEEMG